MTDETPDANDDRRNRLSHPCRWKIRHVWPPTCPIRQLSSFMNPRHDPISQPLHLARMRSDPFAANWAAILRIMLARVGRGAVHF